MKLEELIYNQATSQGAQFVRFVDISKLSYHMTHGFDKAILIGKLLSPEYIKKLKQEVTTDYIEFADREHETDGIADQLAAMLKQCGYEAFSQSEQNLLLNDYFDVKTKRTTLPHKTIAVLSGLGWIGKDNLFVTKEYGSAVCMCTVLTNAPIRTESSRPMESQCHSCTVCQTKCPSRCISGKEWTPKTDRDELINVHTCAQCLKCLANCTQTTRYTRRGLIRPMLSSEYGQLEEFLYQAIYQEENRVPLPRNVIYQPGIYHYISEFGKETDHCLVVSMNHRLIGACWTRVFPKEDPGYGYQEEGTPELAIAILPNFRGHGYGTRLIVEMLSILQTLGYQKVSLSVQKRNRAVSLYQALGFDVIDETKEEYRMSLTLWNQTKERTMIRSVRHERTKSEKSN